MWDINIIQTIKTAALTLIFRQLIIYVYDRIQGRIKYNYIIGNYSHENGTVKIIYIHKTKFKTIGTENNGRVWSGEFSLDGNIGKGNYKWKDKDDWGFHELYVSKNQINGTYINKSHATFNQGTIIWSKNT
jgi:hypothetical protein